MGEYRNVIGGPEHGTLPYSLSYHCRLDHLRACWKYGFCEFRIVSGTYDADSNDCNIAGVVSSLLVPYI